MLSIYCEQTETAHPTRIQIASRGTYDCQLKPQKIVPFLTLTPRQVYLTRKMEEKSQMFPFSTPMESFTFQTNHAYKAYQAIFAAQSKAVPLTLPPLPSSAPLLLFFVS